MILAALAVILLLVSGAAIVASFIVTQRARRDLEQRVTQMVGGGGSGGARSGPKNADPAWIAAFEERCLRVFGFGLKRQWGTRVPSFQVILVAVLAGSTMWALVRVAVQLPFWLALPLTAVSFLLAPRTLLQLQQSRTERRFIELFPDALDMCVRMLRAGLPVSAAIRTIGAEGPPPVNHVFTLIADRVEIGIPLEDALRATGRELGLDEFRFFAAVVALQRSTGGNLAQTLELLAEIMRRRRAMRLKARATTSEVRTSAYILGALPFLIIAALLMVSPDYLEPLMSDSRGHVVLAIAATSLSAAFYSMRRLVRSVTAV